MNGQALGLGLDLGPQSGKGLGWRGERKKEAGTPPTFRPGFLGTSQEILGLDLSAMVFIVRADRGPHMVFIEMADKTPISPTFQEVLRLVPQVFGGAQQPPPPHAALSPTLRTQEGPVVPPEPPSSSVSTRFGERKSWGPQAAYI